MFFHRHCLHVNRIFAETFGAVPPYSPVFVCDTDEAAARLRGNFLVPLLLGTDTTNFADDAVVVELNERAPTLQRKIDKLRAELKPVEEMRTTLKNTNFGLKPYLQRELIKFVDEARVRADIYKLGGREGVRFIGMTTLQQNPGPFIHHGLMEVQTSVEGVARWRPYVSPDEIPLCQRYSPGDFVYCAPPGGYAKICIGQVVDFLDENEMRLRLKL